MFEITNDLSAWEDIMVKFGYCIEKDELLLCAVVHIACPETMADLWKEKHYVVIDLQLNCL